MIEVSSTKRDVHFVKLTVYGQSGVGKTVLCSTAPKPLIISAEAGLLSLAGKDIPVIEVSSFDEMKEAYSFVKNEGDAYDTICLDSISDIAEQVLDAKLMQLQKKADEEGKKVEPRQAYGSMAIEMMRLTRAFRNLDKHIVFTAKQGYINDEVAKTLRFGPMLPGQVYTNNLPYLMDLLLCLRVDKEGVRWLMTQPDLQYAAKDRSGKLAKAEQPNLQNLFDKVMSK
jgi:phage nucleotide-binding protein